MTTNPNSEIRKSDLGVLVILVIFSIAGFVFKDALGLIGFIVLLLATLLQLARVLFFRGSRKTLKQLWAAIRDVVWGL